MKQSDIPSFDELHFDERQHVYTIDQMPLPSVTTIMKPLSGDVYGEIRESTLEKAANRGTAVHNAIENYITFGIDDISSEFAGYYEAFKKWVTDYSPVFLGTECRVYHRIMRYAGTIDLPCIINGETVCVDFKTTSKINDDLVRVQLEAYDKAFSSHGFAFDKKAIVHLGKDGKYKFLMYDKNDIYSWKLFDALFTLYGHRQKYKRS